MTNINLVLANKNKKDEFYTQIKDIENELRHYKEHFKDKTIFCNCDDPYNSNFFKYFAYNFITLGLKRLIATGFPIDKNADGEYVDAIVIDKTLRCDYVKMHRDGIYPAGDFRSKDSIELLEQADIVVTNPPFSLFREYISQLMKYGKNIIVWGNTNAITFKEVFPLLKNNIIWLWYMSNATQTFQIPNGYYKWDERITAKKNDGKKYCLVPSVAVFTNLYIKKHLENLTLCKKYNPKDFPKYDNYDAININKTKDIPYDYNGVMGVPVTFMSKYNPNQFEIVGFRKGNDNRDLRYFVNGEIKEPYCRILIKRKSVIS